MTLISNPPSSRSIFQYPPNFPNGQVSDAWMAWFQEVQANNLVYPTPQTGFALGWDALGNLVNVPNTGADQTAAWTAADAVVTSAFQAADAVVAANAAAGTALVRSDMANTSNPSLGDAMLGVKQVLPGATATTQHEVNSRRVYVEDFGAVGDGVTDDTAAIEKAGQALTSNMTLEFKPNKIYLVSYIWTANTDSNGGESDGAGRGRAIINLRDKSNVRIDLNGATIKVVNHDIAAKGGLVFLNARRCPNLTIDNGRSDMSFTGYKDDASFYPMCGFAIVTDLPSPAGSGTQATLCSNFTARNIRFKHYHPNGAFGITSHPYGGDVNNGFKIVSIFAAGETDASATYAAQNRGLTIENILFEEGHNGYGTWAYAYNDMKFKNVRAEAWIAASYTIATATYSGVSFVAPVRVYQYYCTGLEIDGVFVRSIPQASRTGAFQGVCGGISAFSGVGTLKTGGATITNTEFILDSPSTALSGNADKGIASDLNGLITISKAKFKCHQQSGVTCIGAAGSDNATGSSTYIVTDCQADATCNGPFFQLVNGSNTAAANRTVKSVILTGNSVLGFGAEGFFQSYTSGYTYHGVESLIISKNLEDARGSATAVYAVNCATATATDNIVSTDNIIFSVAAHNLGSATGGAHVVVRDNVVNGATSSSTTNAINYMTNNYWQWQTFTAAQAVVMTIAVGDYNQYIYIEYTGAGAIAFQKSGVANSGTGTIRTVAAGNTGQLTYVKFGSLR